MIGGTPVVLVPALQFLATPSNSSTVLLDDLRAQRPRETHDGLGLEFTLNMSDATRAPGDWQQRISYGDRLRDPTSA